MWKNNWIVIAWKGYEVYNITSPLPTNSIESYLNNIKFGLLLISVTLEENLD
jgi:hypothetical protein